MPTPTQAILDAWSPPFWLTVSVILVSAIYIRGWRAIRRTRPGYFTVERLLCFVCGMVVLWLAIASPIDGFADTLLSAHMVQHFLLMSAVPPLVLLGAPVVPMLRGLPRRFVKSVLGPLIALRWLRRVGDFLTDPVVAWLAFNIVFLAWHLPKAYDYALRNENVHDFEHICFLATALLFWWVILHPWPSRARHNGWMILVYLLSADIVNSCFVGLSCLLQSADLSVLLFAAQSIPHFSALGSDCRRSHYVGAQLHRVSGACDVIDCTARRLFQSAQQAIPRCARDASRVTRATFAA